MLEQNSESLVFVTKNKEDALKVRTDLLSNFKRLWVYVFNINNEEFKVCVANNWGSKLDKKTISQIEKFIKINNTK